MSLFEKYSVEADSYRFEEEGDVLEGVVSEISDELEGEYGPYKFLFVTTDTGASKKIIISSLLRTKLEDKGVAVGDEVGIRYEGMKTGKKGRDYKNWSVLVVKPKNSSLFD